MDRYVLDLEATRRVREDRKAKLKKAIAANPDDTSLSESEIFDEVTLNDPLFSSGIYEDSQGNRYEVSGDGLSRTSAILVQRHFPNSNQPMDLESLLNVISNFYKGDMDPVWIYIDDHPVAVSLRTFRDF